MASLPEHMAERRRQLAERWLTGSGLEIGALHSPVTMPAGVKISYVDRMPREQLYADYPEMKAYDLVNVDIVDDGETLASVPDHSFEFIVACHFIEHTENPLGTMRTHIEKLKPNGRLFYAIPDKRMSFDLKRDLTSFSHLVDDDADGGAGSRTRHFREWAIDVVGLTEPSAIETNVEKNMERNYSIHFHVWDEPSWREFLEEAKRYLGNFDVLHCELSDTEVITVIQRSD